MPEEPSLPLRQSRAWALAAFFLLVTSLLLDWWVIRNAIQGGPTIRLGVGPFETADTLVRGWTWVTGAMVAVVAVWLFVRVAGKSIAYEPDRWARDVKLQAGGVAVALASLWAWSKDLPTWGGRTYQVNDTAQTTVEVSTLPGLGWWCALLALLCLVVAWRRTRAPQDS